MFNVLDRCEINPENTNLMRIRRYKYGISVLQKQIDQGNTTRNMTHPPIQWRYKDSFVLNVLWFHFTNIGNMNKEQGKKNKEQRARNKDLNHVKWNRL